MNLKAAAKALGVMAGVVAYAVVMTYAESTDNVTLGIILVFPIMLAAFLILYDTFRK